MTKSMLFFIAVLIVALGARSVLAGDDREYVGETEATTVPNIGIITMHDLCNASFPAARMCSSSDIIRGGGVKADPPPREAWVSPSLVTGTTAGYVLDASGVTSAKGTLSCSSWSSASSGLTGLVLTSWGWLSVATCNSTKVAVACCALRKSEK